MLGWFAELHCVGLPFLADGVSRKATNALIGRFPKTSGAAAACVWSRQQPSQPADFHAANGTVGLAVQGDQKKAPLRLLAKASSPSVEEWIAPEGHALSGYVASVVAATFRYIQAFQPLR
jgi:hypothetical protein